MATKLYDKVLRVNVPDRLIKDLSAVATSESKTVSEVVRDTLRQRISQPAVGAMAELG